MPGKRANITNTDSCTNAITFANFHFHTFAFSVSKPNSDSNSYADPNPDTNSHSFANPNADASTLARRMAIPKKPHHKPIKRRRNRLPNQDHSILRCRN